MQEIISRAEAKARGLKRYFTGVPCKRGHVAERYVNKSTCAECDRIRKPKDPDRAKELCRIRAQRWRTTEKFQRWRFRYYEENRDRLLEASRKWAAENKEKVLEKGRRWNARNPAARLAASQRWKENNRAWTREYARLQRLKDPEKHKEYCRVWRKLNPGASAIYDARRKARKLGRQNERITVSFKRALLVRQSYLCVYCDADLRAVKKNLDHRISLARGGTHTRDNLQYTCEPCNKKKHAKNPLDFMSEQDLPPKKITELLG